MPRYAGPQLLHNAATATGDGVAIDLENYSAALVNITGTFVATITFEANLDDNNDSWVAVSARNLATGARGTTTATTGQYFISAPGAKEVRARISAYTSGSVTVRGRAVENASPESSDSPVAADINNGFLTHTATTAAATLLTVPAGKTWVGTVTVSCSLSKAAAATGDGSVRAVIATAGAGATPAAGTILALEAKAGANAASGLAGTQGSNSTSIPVTIVAGSANATLTLATTVANATEARVDAAAYGANQ